MGNPRSSGDAKKKALEQLASNETIKDNLKVHVSEVLFEPPLTCSSLSVWYLKSVFHCIPPT